MPALGTLACRHFRPHIHTDDVSYKTRGAIGQALIDHIRAASAFAPVYPADRWHYPVRLGDRGLPFFAGTSATVGWPWTGTAQPITDANGRLYYHPHRVPILWAAGAGARTLTVTVQHDYTAPPYPYVLIQGRPDLGLDDERLDCPSTPSTEHELEHTFTLTADALIQFWLCCDNVEQTKVTTWQTIATS